MERLNLLSGSYSFASVSAAFCLVSGLLSQTILLVFGIKLPVLFFAFGFVLLSIFLAFWAGVEKWRAEAAAIAVPFLLWATVSIVWTPSVGYVYEKLAGLIVCTFLFWLPIITGRICINYFLRVYLLLTVLILFFSTFGMLKSAASFYSLTDAQRSIYLTSGYFVGGLLAILGFFSFSKSSFIDLAVILFALLCLLLTGARGPLMFGLGMLLIGLMLRGRWRILSALALLAFFPLLIIQFLSRFDQVAFFIDRAIERFGLLFEGELASRTDLWGQMGVWLANDSAVLVGFGTGSWGWVVNGYDERSYPHNIVLEILFENGLIGLVFFSLLFSVSIWAALKSWRPHFIVIVALLCYEVLNFMKSFTISDARMLFFLMGVLIAEGLRSKRECSLLKDQYECR